MILKELQMDIPFIRKGYDNNSIEEYESTWKWKRRQFQLMTRCMTSMIERMLPSLKTKDYWKILIECVDDNPKYGFTNMLGVCVIQIKFDIDSFFEMEDIDKKRYVISKIIDTMSLLSLHGLSEVDVIKDVCNDIIIKDYVNEWYWKKNVKKKDNTVQIKLVHDIDEISIYMVFNPNSNTMVEKLLLKTVPDEWIYSKYLGELEWVSDTKAQLITKEGEIYCCNFCV